MSDLFMCKLGIKQVVTSIGGFLTENIQIEFLERHIYSSFFSIQLV